jgi:oxygen-dependent protoporphyrinogen oxidase
MVLPQANVAVLGGGLTGLSAAYHLARRNPHVHVTLYEKTPRLGGWVRSERVELDDLDGNRASLVLEAAPRTLRPNAKSVLELVRASRPPARANNPLTLARRSTCSICASRC